MDIHDNLTFFEVQGDLSDYPWMLDAEDLCE